MIFSLHHVTTLYHYDGPLIATMRGSNGRLFLASAIDMVEGAEDDASGDQIVFGVVEVSQRRLRAVVANCTTMREAFRFPEFGDPYRLTVEGHMRKLTAYPVDPATQAPLPLDDLARPGYRLRARTQALRWKKNGRCIRVNRVGRRRPRPT